MKERIIVGADGRKYITNEPQIDKREWQGLTDTERVQCELGAKNNYFEFARAIEAKLKEKNG